MQRPPPTFPDSCLPRAYVGGWFDQGFDDVWRLAQTVTATRIRAIHHKVYFKFFLISLDLYTPIFA
jgi:hypothetical protein